MTGQGVTQFSGRLDKPLDVALPGTRTAPLPRDFFGTAGLQSGRPGCSRRKGESGRQFGRVKKTRGKGPAAPDIR
jgi:hypothetical protein